MLKSVKNILLSVLLVLGTIGIVGNAHICNGVLKAINMQPSHECCEKGMDMDMKTDCCENNAHHVKIESHYDQVIDVVIIPSFTYQEMMKDLWESAFSYILPNDIERNSSVALTEFSSIKSPPLFREVPINIIHQKFII